MTNLPKRFFARAWSNGSPSEPGAGYGLRVSKADRDMAFSKDWPAVTLLLPDGHEICGEITPSFWRKCSEIRSAGIGQWLLRERLAPWPKGRPPTVVLEPAGPARFRVSRVNQLGDQP